MMENIIQGVTENHVKDSIVIAQYGFIRGKCFLANVICFYDEVTHLAGQGKPGVVFWISAKISVLFLTTSF